MPMEFRYSELFTKQVKKLNKNNKSIPDDIEGLEKELKKTPDKGDVIKGTKGGRKVRMAIASRNEGKSGGARIIYYLQNEPAVITFLAIYDKRVLETMSHSQIKEIVISMIPEKATE